MRRHRTHHLAGHGQPIQSPRARRARGGRPSKFTPDRVERFLNAIRAGATLVGAAQSVGWSEYGLTSYRRSFSDFADQIAEAEGAAQVYLVAVVRQAAQTDWRAAMELLGRRWPAAWGRHDRVDVELRMQLKRLAAELELSEQEILAEAEPLVAGH